MPSTFPTAPQILSDMLGVVFRFFSSYWWIIIPPALFLIAFEVWIVYIEARWSGKTKWVLLEIKVPKEVEQPYKSMEQVFFGMFSLHQALNLRQKYWDGEFQPWTSFEMYGHDGGIQLFVRTPEKFRRMVESLLYAQYPDAELVETQDDYALRYHNLPDQEQNVWGTEMTLARESAYPIRTYEYYEEQKEEKRLDPLAPLLEVMSTCKAGEEIWYQMIIQPPADRGEKMRGEGRVILDKLLGKKKASAPAVHEHAIEFLWNFIKAPFEHPTWTTLEAKKDEGPPSLAMHLSPGEKAVVEAIEEKIATLSFRVVIRWLYHAPRSVFARSRISEILSSFRQFSSNDLNSLKLNSKITPQIDYWWQFKSRRELLRTKSLFANYQIRALNILSMPKSLLSVTELATMYHFPISMVQAPMLQRLEYKKGAPPPTLPVEEQELPT